MEYLFEGKISVKAALFSPYRNLHKIIIEKNKDDRDTRYILRNAKEKNILVEYTNREDIDKLTSGKTHGGIIAYGSDRSFQSLDEIIKDQCFIALVEGVEDPFNFGFVLRSLYAAGVDGIILSPRNWTSAASTLAKSSAGASELMKMVVVEDFASALQQLKKQHVAIVCAQRDDKAIEMYDYNFQQSVCICIGGEKRGLSKIILAASDQDVFIPYRSDFKNALSAASATTILAYEIVRQRKK